MKKYTEGKWSEFVARTASSRQIGVPRSNSPSWFCGGWSAVRSAASRFAEPFTWPFHVSRFSCRFVVSRVFLSVFHDRARPASRWEKNIKAAKSHILHFRGCRESFLVVAHSTTLPQSPARTQRQLKATSSIKIVKKGLAPFQLR